MKAIQLERPESFHLIDVPEPTAPGPGEALLRVHRVGICGTDYGGFLGKMPFYSYPRIPGHELGVEVAAVGEGVNNVQVGDKCCVEPYLNCQNCHSCRRGHTNCCQSNQTLGVHCDGGLRPFFLLPARKLHQANGLSYEQSALVETLAIGCHAVNRGRPVPGETILVIGAGPIGLSVVEFARISGARTIVMDMNPQRLEFVRNIMKVPDTIVVKGDGSELKTLEALTGGDMADVVIDASVAEAVPEHLTWALETGTNLVIGATGWSMSDLEAKVAGRIGVLTASNFSLTVALMARLATVVGRFAALDVARDPYLVEHHHRLKADAPSGTAKTLAAAVMAGCPRKTGWTLTTPAPHQLSIGVIRAGVEVGTHTVGLDAPAEVLELTHMARSRAPFAQGALVAARWLHGRKGLFTMDELASDLLDPLFMFGGKP